MGIPVNTVYHAVKAGFVFVQLKESRNAFTYELVAKLRKSISVLTLRTYVVSIK